MHRGGRRERSMAWALVGSGVAEADGVFGRPRLLNAGRLGPSPPSHAFVVGRNEFQWQVSDRQVLHRVIDVKIHIQVLLQKNKFTIRPLCSNHPRKHPTVARTNQYPGTLPHM